MHLIQQLILPHFRQHKIKLHPKNQFKTHLRQKVDLLALKQEMSQRYQFSLRMKSVLLFHLEIFQGLNLLR